jgi:copper(I)-binding protein
VNASCAPRSRRIGAGFAVAAGALLALGGCAAGQHAQTAEEVPVVDGVGAQAGPIALRAVTVTPPSDNNYPAGGDATLELIIVNQSRSDDKLVEVSTPAADEVRLFANQADSTFTPPPPTPTMSASGTGSSTATGTGTATGTATGTPTGTATGSPTGTGGTSASGTETASGAATSTAPAAPSTIESIDLPAGGHTLIGYEPDQNVIQLHGLTKQLFPAQAFPITFRFEHAGAVTFTVSVHLASPPANRPSLDISPTGEG